MRLQMRPSMTHEIAFSERFKTSSTSGKGASVFFVFHRRLDHRQESIGVAKVMGGWVMGMPQVNKASIHTEAMAQSSLRGHTEVKRAGSRWLNRREGTKKAC